MEPKPLRSRQGTARGSRQNEETPSPGSRGDAPLPVDEWAAMGSTRVVPPPTEFAPTQNLAEALPSPAEKETVVGDFRLLKKLGEGAMGAVYKAHQISFNRDVALKILFKHVANIPKLVERLYREGKVMFQLDHPNIVQAYACDQIEGWHYVAMEFVDGHSLQHWLNRLGRLSLGDALHVALACARALEYAHEQGVVHRDIKPDNVLISRKGAIKVADLGMVKQLDEDMSLTQTGHAVGTPWYMPLEQAKNAKEIDRRCDIYALGCMLYCMLTEHPPFRGQTLVEVIQAKEMGTFPAARSVNADVPERLDLIIAKATAKLAKYRYQTCADLIKDLESLHLDNAELTFVKAPAGKPAAAIDRTAATLVSEGPLDLGTTAPDVWHLRYKNAAGHVKIRQLTTAQVLKLIEDPQFDPEATASRQKNNGFRSLATYKEFKGAVLGRLSKGAADEKTARFRSLYKKIEAQEKSKDEAEDKPVGTAGYWLSIFLRVAGACAVVGVIALILKYFGTNLGR